MPAGKETGLLNFIQEPVFVMSPSGIVLQANAAARQFVRTDPTGRRMADLVTTPEDDVLAWLRLCSGTTSPLVGSLTFRCADGRNERFRVYGARLSGSGPSVRIALRCMPARSSEFSVLARQVHDLNAEIRERRRVQAVLEEALAQNDTLLRELHHRVKNNIQVLRALFTTAQREAGSEEVRRFLEDANRRLLAVGAAQSLMYQSQQLATVPAASFIRSLCNAVGTTLGPAVQLEISAEPAELSNEAAFPLALIVNELLTNAFKHGLPDGRGKIRVRFLRREQQLELVIQDDGPGFASESTARRSSGLGLVRGLCRQLGADLIIENVGGARVTVRFGDASRRGREEQD